MSLYLCVDNGIIVRQPKPLIKSQGINRHIIKHENEEYAEQWYFVIVKGAPVEDCTMLRRRYKDSKEFLEAEYLAFSQIPLTILDQLKSEGYNWENPAK